MASIAYVSDDKMMEYHRLHGHRQIAFWRFSNKKFSDFKTNDFLFFLCKTRRKEKGIIGYGQLKEIRNLSVDSTYHRYQQATGYHSLQQFQQSIQKLNKNPQFNQKLNVLVLNHIIYLKSPIYLSEFGFELSKQVESYIYLDQNENITSKIFHKVSQIGYDLWSEVQEKNESYHHPVTHGFLYEIARSIQAFKLLQSQRHRQLINEYNKDKQLETLVMVDSVVYFLDKDNIKLYIPMINQLDKEVLATYGLIQYLLQHHSNIHMDFVIIINSECQPLTQQVFKDCPVVIQSL